MGVIDIKDLSFSYGNNVVFDNLSLSIKDGSFTTIIGNNNSGKTTLIKLLLGFEKSNGITILGKDLNTNKRYIRKNAGVIFSTPSVFFVFDTVRAELFFASNDEKYILKVVKDLKMEDLLMENPMKLSLNKQYLVALAICLISKFKIIILDDIFINSYVYSVLKKVNKQGVTIINFTTNTENIMYGNNVIVLDKKVVFTGTNKKLLNHLDVLNSLNMDVPFMLDLSEKLMFYGLVDKKYTNMEKLVNDIWKSAS